MPTITLTQLGKTGSREDFLVRVQGPEPTTDETFPLSVSDTISAIWNLSIDDASAQLADRLVYSHGTASAFPEGGYWFDSYNSASTLQQTLNKIDTDGSRYFQRFSREELLGNELYELFKELNTIFQLKFGLDFIAESSLDSLVERSRATEDLSSEAKDHAHFIYRVCILSAIIDRFNFKDFDRNDPKGSLNGLRTWLTEKFSEEVAKELTSTYQMVKNLRKQYPIHGNFTTNRSGEQLRVKAIADAEVYFELRDSFSENWFKVRAKFLEACKLIHDKIEAVENR